MLFRSVSLIAFSRLLMRKSLFLSSPAIATVFFRYPLQSAINARPLTPYSQLPPEPDGCSQVKDSSLSSRSCTTSVPSCVWHGGQKVLKCHPAGLILQIWRGLSGCFNNKYPRLQDKSCSWIASRCRRIVLDLLRKHDRTKNCGTEDKSALYSVRTLVA